MTGLEFRSRIREMFAERERLLANENTPLPHGNGIFDRYAGPVLTAAHAPLFWRYDLDYRTNPNLLERLRPATVRPDQTQPGDHGRRRLDAFLTRSRTSAGRAAAPRGFVG